MTTSKPRVSVTLEPDLYDDLRELAQLNGESLSAVIGGLLEAVAPTVRRVVTVGRQFQALSGEMKDEVRGRFAAAEAKISPALHDLTEQALAALDAVEPTTEDPRPVTRGSRPPLRSHPLDKSGLEQ